MAQTISDLQYLPLQTTMPLMNPQYPPQYYQKFTLLKKHIQLKLFNSTANQLAQWLIPYGQTNYNCWYVKKMCFLSGAVTFEHQIAFSETTLYQKIKNFQLWQHRRFLLEHNNKNYHSQYQLINTILQIEPKNYHAWSHRIWILNQVNNYSQEIQFTHQMLAKDPYNNSVWSYRSYLVSKLIQAQANPQQQQKIVYVQVSECMASLIKQLNNQAAWNYLRGYFPSIKLKNIPCTNSHVPKMPATQLITNRVLQFIKVKVQELQTMFKQQNFIPQHAHLQAEVQLLISLACLYSQNQDTLQYAKNTCLVLAEKDTQKRYYWKWVASNI